MTPHVAAKTPYALLPLFLLAAVLAWASPAFWQRVELRQGVVADAYGNSDLYQFYYPALSYGFGRLRAGEFPLWNPHQHCGVPFQPDPRMGLFEPLHVVFASLPTEQAMAIHAFLCLFLMGLFFAFFARSLNVRYTSALIGGIIYAFCGVSAATMSRPVVASALVWIPLMFWGIREYGRRFRYSYAVLAGIAAGGLILSGTYALAMVALLVAVPYRLVLTYLPESRSPRRFVERVAGLVLMGIVALGVSCVQWLSVVLWLPDLAHPGELFWNLDFAAQASPGGVRELFPQAFMSQAGMLPRLGYMGIGTWLLVPAALFHRGSRRHVLFFAGAAVALVVATVLGVNRVPQAFPRHAFLFMLPFCVATLAAVGSDRLLVAGRDHRSTNIWMPASAVLLLAAVLFSASAGAVRGLIIVFVVILVPFLVARARWLAPVCGVILAALLYLDMSLANNNGYRHPYQDAPGCYAKYSGALDATRQELLGGRAVLSSGALDTGMPANLGMLIRMNVVDGWRLPLDKAQDTWRRQLMGEPLPAGETGERSAAQPLLFDYMAARVFAATPEGSMYSGEWQGEGPRLRTANEVDGVRVFINSNALPRAFWRPSWRSVESVADAIRVLTDPSFNPARECVVEGLPASGAADTDPGSQTTTAVCSVEAGLPERVVLRVSAPVDGIAVLSDSYARGWRSKLDDAPCRLLRVNGIFRGVATPAGDHEIVFEYSPPGFVIGACVSIGCLAVVGLSALATLLRRS